MSYSDMDAYNDGRSDYNYSYGNKCTHATGKTLFDGVEERTGKTLQIVLCTWGCNEMLIMKGNKVFTSLYDAFEDDIL